MTSSRSGSTSPAASSNLAESRGCRARFLSSAGLSTAPADAAASSHHYDVSNDFYALWLDRRLVYSCAYFTTGEEDINEAQEVKLDHICRKLRLIPGERLLDIGCGW